VKIINLDESDDSVEKKEEMIVLKEEKIKNEKQTKDGNNEDNLLKRADSIPQLDIPNEKKRRNFNFKKR